MTLTEENDLLIEFHAYTCLQTANTSAFYAPSQRNWERGVVEAPARPSGNLFVFSSPEHISGIHGGFLSLSTHAHASGDIGVPFEGYDLTVLYILPYIFGVK